MGRKPCCSKEEGLNRGAWTAAEDKILTDYITMYGEGKWRYLPKRAGLKRCGKSCRLRWLNYLRPDIKRGNISHDEEELIIRLHNLLGNRWSLIAGRLPGRTDNEIKNYWNTNIRKKLQDHHHRTSLSSSTGCTRQTLSQCPEKPKFGSKQFIADTDSYPIRTRASKCTKVLFLSTPEQERCCGQDQVIVGPAPLMANGPIDDIIDDDQNEMKGGGTVLPEFNMGDNDPSDFMIDFEMDEHFLSLLDTDLPQLPNLDDTNNIGGDIISTSNICGKDKGYCSSQNSDDKVKDSEFASMDELIRSEFEWFS